ncbi:MAG: extracellular solute-binding protein [Parvibaculales bacterium]
MMRKAVLLKFFILMMPFVVSPVLGQTHGISMHGQPALAASAPFSYTDPRPITGGEIHFAKLGSFDSLNPFIIRGQTPYGLREHVYESLLAQHFDEPFALYGLLAESVSTSDDRSQVTFKLNKRAAFSDGHPVTVEDVVFSFETLRDKGRPNHRYYYGKVVNHKTDGERSITFIFDREEQDYEMPLIMGLMPILPKHVFAGQDFSKTSLDRPLGSGPYVVADVVPGKKITYEKNPDYWGQSLPVNQGRHNIKLLHYDYYRDENAAFEAFKSGLVDVWEETNPIRWTRGYNFPAARDGRIIKENIQTGTPSGLNGFAFNTRRAVFQDQNVRKALANLFNFEWANKTLYAGAYTRTHSYFQKSDLSSYNQAASAEEKKLLRKSGLPNSLIDSGYKAPDGDPSGRNRAARAESITLLKAAGYEILNGQMINARTKAPLTFEIIVQSRKNERLAMAYKQMLSRIGVMVSVRFIDSAQYQNRLQAFDYDMMVYNWYASLSPGNEQAFYWGSEAAGQNGSRNYPGIQDKHIDAAINQMTRARTRRDFATAARALDRLLMGGDYVVPLFHQPTQWVARWHQVEHSWRHALYGAKFDSWWINPDN